MLTTFAGSYHDGNVTQIQQTARENEMKHFYFRETLSVACFNVEYAATVALHCETFSNQPSQAFFSLFASFNDESRSSRIFISIHFSFASF